MTPETAERIAKMIPMLSSDQPGDITATVAAIRRTLESVGLSFHDLAKVVQQRGALKITTMNASSLDDVFRAPTEKTATTSRPERPRDASVWRYVISIAPYLLDENLSEQERSFVDRMRTGARRQQGAFRMTEAQARRWEGLLDHFNF